jgi:hypothetical protein
LGLILGGVCARCGFERSKLRVGATMEQMSGERRSFLHLLRCGACRDIVAVELALGEPAGSPPCPLCGAALEPRSDAYRVVNMKGLALDGHTCPRCGERGLSFHEEGRFL